MPSAKSFLSAHPVGVYTCARCVPVANGGRRVLQWRFHLERLAAGLAMDMLLDDGLRGLLEGTSTSLQMKLVGMPLDVTDTRHRMLTVLWVGDDQTVSIHVHLCVMPQVSLEDAVTVLVHGAPRDRPQCKHSKWITDREPLEQHMRHVEQSHATQLKLLECILHDDSNRLYEGLISNFFVVQDGAIYTAPQDTVLPGSTRAQVLAACDALDIPVVLAAPRLADVPRWRAAFLTSTCWR
ncbi:hypothetical protein P43SY_008646 [Pythium insidiosum]|uniref:Aminodeoxychorismate lyase n=1 Tax=Pythium insidiosum TaxID=114742 RepID=A0AAD5LCF6_PYTIN|nr:hypothetical protein P43SY_008646 [Pythium insidiosum]